MKPHPHPVASFLCAIAVALLLYAAAIVMRDAPCSGARVLVCGKP